MALLSAFETLYVHVQGQLRPSHYPGTIMITARTGLVTVHQSSYIGGANRLLLGVDDVACVTTQSNLTNPD
jgi:hypothetical protein